MQLDNSLCPNIHIGTVTICIYGTDGNLLHTYSYTDARCIAADLLSLPAGHYTLGVVVNVVPEAEDMRTLTALYDWLEAAPAADRRRLLSGIAEVEVTADGISRAVVLLCRAAFPLPVLRLQLSLPESNLPDYIPAKTGTRTADDTYIIRCVAELVKSGTDQVVLHKAVTPERQADGTFLVELSAFKGDYDLRLWTDYAHTDTPLADTYYQTENLRAIPVMTDPYTANTDAKDAAYYNESNITLPREGATIDVQLQRPLAKYRIVADDVEAYRKLAATEPQKYPPLEELTVTVRYESFFPSEFNAVSGKVTDSTTDIAYSTGLTDDAAADGLTLCTDWILTSGESAVTATLTVSDRSGRPVCRVSQVQIAYRMGHLTTLRGKFLTAGIGSGGIHIDTGWEEVIVPF